MQLIGQAGVTTNVAYRRENLAQVSLLPAAWGFTQLLFGRISYKFWGFCLLAISLFLVSYFNYFAATDSIHTRYVNTRFKAFDLPTTVTTKTSPLEKQVKEAKIIEDQSPIQTMPKISTGIPPYSKKLRVFATSYDKTCPGCSSTTASGLPTGYGVVAVDPKIIPLGTKLFIPGYGEAVAGDTGGSIKGNKIDLGFDSVKSGWWSSRFVEIYILK